MVTRLIHINGLPGLGKSSLAEVYAQSQPLTLVVDIDQLRTQLGGWQDQPESQLIARDLALALIAAHLESGHDVVVPQFLGRLDFIERLAAAAHDADAMFAEVTLMADRSVAVQRFRQRRTQMQAGPGRHPEADVADEDIDAVIDDAIDALTRVGRARPSSRVIDASGDIAELHSLLLAALAPRAQTG